MFVSQARRFGNKTLYRFTQQGQWQSLSWNDALLRVRGIALGLLSLGVERGDRIAILSNNRVEWNLIDWANICIGALTVPIYASGTRLQALHVVGHSDPTVLFVESAQKLRQLELQSHSLDRLKSVVVIEGRNGDTGVGIDTPVLTLDRLCEIGQAHGEGHDGIFERLVGSLQPEDDLTIIYTSGTTGTPKGVLTTHAHYLYMIRAVDAAVPSTDQDVTLHFLPSAHSLGRLER
jgi:long-chain acyl-CoA synthetase